MLQPTSAPAALLLVLTISSLAAAADGYPDRFELVLGGIREGSGIASGIEYTHSHFASGFFDLRLSSRVSLRLYQQHEAEIVIPHLFHPSLSLELLGVYRSYTQVAFFGIGPDTVEEDRSNYHIEGPAFYATLGFRPARRITVGGKIGRLSNDLHSGGSGKYPSIEAAFSPEELSGYVEEPDHFMICLFASVDGRNDGDDPTAGFFYEIQATRYRDRDFDRFDFDELQIEAQHFAPLGRRTTYASRIKGLLTRAGEGKEVPFYLLPSLGGTESLHAFAMDRFRDRNLLFLNNELRYQATPKIRLEAFLDVGQVFPEPGDIRFSRFELGAGVAIRFKYERRVLVGVSLGLGREGPRVAVTGDFRF